VKKFFPAGAHRVSQKNRGGRQTVGVGRVGRGRDHRERGKAPPGKKGPQQGCKKGGAKGFWEATRGKGEFWGSAKGGGGKRAAKCAGTSREVRTVGGPGQPDSGGAGATWSKPGRGVGSDPGKYQSVRPEQNEQWGGGEELEDKMEKEHPVESQGRHCPPPALGADENPRRRLKAGKTHRMGFSLSRPT